MAMDVRKQMMSNPCTSHNPSDPPSEILDLPSGKNKKISSIKNCWDGMGNSDLEEHSRGIFLGGF